MGFRGDDRAVSNVIGAVLIFATLIVLLSIYQSQVVPAQNRAAEFEHSNGVQDDMVELRNALLTAKTAGRTTFAEVDLGTRYQTRILAVNPPPASGRLETSDPRPIAVSAGGSTPNICPSGGTIQTRTLRFKPGYNVYQNAPDVVYENTVLYLDFGDRQIPLTDEQLVTNDGNAVDITPLNTSLDLEGLDTVSVEPVPGAVRERELTDATVTLPTNLSQSTWRDLLAEDLPASNVTVSDGNLTLQTGGEISVACSPLGLNEAPAGGERSDSTLDINPAGPNDVELRDVSRSGNEITAQFNNTADRNTNFTAVRMPFAFVAKSNVDAADVDPYDVINGNTSQTVKNNLEITGPLTPLDTDIELAGNRTRTDVTFAFDNGGQSDFNQGGFFVVTVEFTNGATGTYFLEIPD
ncbi:MULTISPECIES: hypothetical protein [Salinibaculum]|uniref:hypothetical protein n=1 Tax=Salinibaculum TaxID=2732368 RepID=UPI0030CA6FC1